MANTIAVTVASLGLTTTPAATAECKAVRQRGTPSQFYHNHGRLLPASTGESPAPYSCFITKLVLTNTHGSALAVTVQDRQTTPVKLLDAYSLATKSTLALDFGPEGIFMKDGITWFAGTADLVSAFLTVKK